MKFITAFLLFSSFNTFAEIKTIEQEIRTKHCYLTVTEPVIISSAKEFVMAGDVRLNVITRDYQRSRRLQTGRTFKIRSIDGNLISVTDSVVKSFCVVGGPDKECQDISETNKSSLGPFSKSSLKMICEDQPMVDV